MTELRRYNLFRQQVVRANEAAEEERQEMERIVAANAEELRTLREASTRFQSMRLALVDQLSVSGEAVREAERRRDAAERLAAASTARYGPADTARHVIGCHFTQAMGCTGLRVAAKGGHREVLRWVREHHCPWIQSSCR